MNRRKNKCGRDIRWHIQQQPGHLQCTLMFIFIKSKQGNVASERYELRYYGNIVWICQFVLFDMLSYKKKKVLPDWVTDNSQNKK